MSRLLRSHWLIASALTILTVAAYINLKNNAFVHLHDGTYVFASTQVRQGLTWDGVAWAWSNLQTGCFQPVTWMSFQIDAAEFGQKYPGQTLAMLGPAGCHFHSLFWHVASTVLLFSVLQRMTGAAAASAVVAALFAVHPLHVESVAWVAQRQEVLSTFLWLASMAAYVHYTEKRKTLWYAAVLLSYSLALLAMPLPITLPLVLLLLDVWPLRRVQWRAAPTGTPAQEPVVASVAAALPSTARRPLALLLEKIPLLVLATAAGYMAMVAARSVSAAQPVQELSVVDRLANAVAAYGWYVQKAFWPTGLAVYYPPQGVHWDSIQVLAGAALLVAGTLASLFTFRRVPALLIGWLWFLITLAPSIGLCQSADPARVDHFSYLPDIGLFVGLVWAAAALLRAVRLPAAVSAGVAATAVAALAYVSFGQVQHWRNTETLWVHAVEATTGNDRAHTELGNLYLRQYRVAEARQHYEEAAEIQPSSAEHAYNVGRALMVQGETALAAARFQQAVRLDGSHLDAAYRLGLAELDLGQVERASDVFQHTLDSRPDAADALAGLGLVLWQQGRSQAAEERFNAALEFNSSQPEALNGLGLVRLRQQRAEEAVQLFRAAVAAQPDRMELRSNIGVALGRLGHWADASEIQRSILQFAHELRLTTAHRALDSELALYHRRLGFALSMLGKSQGVTRQYAMAMKLDPSWPRQGIASAWQLATSADPPERDGTAAFELASMACQSLADPSAESLDVLGAACAAAGRFAEAKSAAQEALAKASPEVAMQIAARLKLYESGKAFVAAKK